jgi:DNA-binding LytR/AlgR family response regulator
MEKYKYIIVDDELPSHLTVQHHFEDYPNYKCEAVFSNPEKALFFLKEHEIDLIFLDIEMPEMNGFQFLEALEKKIFVVILTGHEKKHGLEAHQYYDKDLVFFSNKAQFSYYLPKIIARFEKMYAEKEMLNRVHQLSKNEITTFPKKINNNTILLTDIVYITVIEHNIVLQMKNGEELIYRMSLLELLDILPSNIFFQIRRNIIVNIGYVTSFSNATVCINNQHFIISFRNRKQVVPALRMQRNFLHKTMD